MRFGFLTLTLGGVASLATAWVATPAAAQTPTTTTGPDLAITADSIVNCAPNSLRPCPPTVGASCQRDRPLWGGFVTIKNVGNGDFTPGGGGGGATATGNITLGATTAPQAAAGAVVQVYVANNANFRDVRPIDRALRPFEQIRVELAIGAGMEKHCDTFGVPPRIGSDRTVRADPLRNNIIGVQRLLNARLPANQAIVEDGIFGSQTARAVEAVFERELIPIPQEFADEMFDFRPGVSDRTLSFLYRTLDPTGSVSTNVPARSTAVTDSCERLALAGQPQRVTLIVEVNPLRNPPELRHDNNRRSFVVELPDCR